jgi:predicted metal-dependent phosphotriesterase family hydrolase
MPDFKETFRMSGQVITVKGPIGAAELGFTLSHEHLILDFFSYQSSYDDVLDEEKVMIWELQHYIRAGGKSLVDCTNMGLKRDHLALRRIAEAAGANIIMGCGWYRERVYPSYVYELSTNELADRMVREIEVGVDGTDIRAGMIGEIGTEINAISPAQERVFRAAARAQRRTGVSIWTHTTHFGSLALEQIALLKEEGVPTDRMVISHLGDRFDCEFLRPIAETGVFMSIDNIGYEGNGYPDDEVRAKNIAFLIREGFIRQVMMSMDIGAKRFLLSYKGHGFAHLIQNFLPRLRSKGITEEDISIMTVDNPARALSVAEKKCADQVAASGARLV